jgi:hypothetical protein
MLVSSEIDERRPRSARSGLLGPARGVSIAERSTNNGLVRRRALKLATGRCVETRIRARGAMGGRVRLHGCLCPGAAAQRRLYAWPLQQQTRHLVGARGGRREIGTRPPLRLATSRANMPERQRSHDGVRPGRHATGAYASTDEAERLRSRSGPPRRGPAMRGGHLAGEPVRLPVGAGLVARAAVPGAGRGSLLSCLPRHEKPPRTVGVLRLPRGTHARVRVCRDRSACSPLRESRGQIPALAIGTTGSSHLANRSNSGKPATPRSTCRGPCCDCFARDGAGCAA